GSKALVWIILDQVRETLLLTNWQMGELQLE
ncbi:hypothetical protein CEXT_161461, partial [Caerostris extrusa]